MLAKLTTGEAAHPDLISVIVPTYQEAENIPHLVARLSAVRDTSGLPIEVTFMDDDSGDGSPKVVDSLGLGWVKLVTRTSNRGLSYAVMDGLKQSPGDVVVVMDADLSHPPEAIPQMLEELRAGADLVVGSRFADGGSTADDWGPFRWLNSRVATTLAFPLTRISDPMSGFFAMRRATFADAENLNPIGYKILLELIVKCRCQLIVEVPIHFDNRRYGESKLSFKEQMRYFRHLRRLYTFKYGTWSHLAQFLVVGASGVAINLLVLTAALRFDIGEKSAVAIAIVVSMIWNFALNRRFSFSYARDQSIVSQFFGFIAACSVGGLVNYFTTMALWDALPYQQLAALAGVLAGTFFNFAASRYFIFRAKHVRKMP
jgi:dolichol-phosphate mannosyltransferase